YIRSLQSFPTRRPSDLTSRSGTRTVVGHLWSTTHATLAGIVDPRLARVLHLVQRVVHQQHVARQTRRRGYPLLEEQQGILGALQIGRAHSELQSREKLV